MDKLIREMEVRDSLVGPGKIELVDRGGEVAPRFMTYFRDAGGDILRHYFDELLEAELDWARRCERGW